MIFSELYSVYYNTVAKILSAALEGANEKELQKIVSENAFSESILTIMPALKSGKWQLLTHELSPVIKSTPTMPLTLLQKRWLKSLADDPRLALFGISLPELDGVRALFTKDDYKLYDKYSDGDSFEDELYIKNFRMMLHAVKKKLPVRITMNNRYGQDMWFRFYPIGFEYSQKDDKIRVIANGCRFKHFNLGRIHTCELCESGGSWWQKTQEDKIKEVTLEITDERNALERVMLHFAHFEKQAERISDDRYILRLKYYESDETEIVIRTLSFGPCIKATAPLDFVNLIKDRLISQKSCELR